jgi:hypothetical protein
MALVTVWREPQNPRPIDNFKNVGGNERLQLSNRKRGILIKQCAFTCNKVEKRVSAWSSPVDQWVVETDLRRRSKGKTRFGRYNTKRQVLFKMWLEQPKSRHRQLVRVVAPNESYKRGMFPESGFGQGLQTIANTINGRSVIGASRQIFLPSTRSVRYSPGPTVLARQLLVRVGC